MTILLRRKQRGDLASRTAATATHQRQTVATSATMQSRKTPHKPPAARKNSFLISAYVHERQTGTVLALSLALLRPVITSHNVAIHPPAATMLQPSAPSLTAADMQIQQVPLSPMPLYSRIRDELRAQIISGAYRVHDRLPSESELIAQYGVSRITVRHALSELEKEGVLFKVAGKGVFVSKPKPFQSLTRLQGFAEAMSRHGHEIYNRVVAVNPVPANAEVAARLGVRERDTVTEIRRVRYLNREPVSFDITYVQSHIGNRLAREDLATRDIFLIIENDYGIALGFADLTIDAVIATDELARLLKIPAGDAVLRVARLTHTAAGAPLDFEYLYCRSDNFQFRLRIERQT